MNCELSLTVEELSNLEYQEDRYIDKLCVPENTEEKDRLCGHKIPNNNEFKGEIDYRRSCTVPVYDNETLSASTSCVQIPPPNDSTKGYACKVKRASYLANKEMCCISDTPIIDNFTCHPSFRGFTPECKELNKNFCSIGDNIVTNKHCLKMRDKDNDTYSELLLDLCNYNTDFFNKNIKTCLDICFEKRGKCDLLMKNFCEQNKDSLDNDYIAYCSCINIKPKYKEMNVSVACDQTCQSYGYKTKAMENVNNCQLVDCSLYFNTGKFNDENSFKFDGNTVITKCGNPDPNTPIVNNVLLNDKIITPIEIIDEYHDPRLMKIDIMIPLLIFIFSISFLFTILLYFL